MPLFIQKDISLLPLNTFHLAANADYFVLLNSMEELLELRHTAIFKEQKRLILGGGSNVLFTKNFEGLVIKNNLQGIEIIREDAHHFYVKACGGVVWHQFVRWCIEKNMAGVENLSLIPGTVGAAPLQNIGAYGVELKDVCDEVEAMDLEKGEIRIFKNEECNFGYRESIFKHTLKDKFFITAVTFKLFKTPHFNIDYGDIKNTLGEMQVYDLTIKAVSDAVIAIRSAKLPDPTVLGNAGSFFKNTLIPKTQAKELLLQYPLMPNFPQQDDLVKIPTAWLIEQCGLKGKRIGNTGSHVSQALVLVNYGNATGQEILNLVDEIIASVQKKFNILITPEVNLI